MRDRERDATKQTAYLAGPMRGYPEYNFPAFHAAAAKLREHGLEVWSPAENDVNQDGFDPAKDTAQPMIHYMRRDLPAVLNADMVCVLPGWEKSQGARLEVHVALTCGLPVYEVGTFTPISALPSETAPTADESRLQFLVKHWSSHYKGKPFWKYIEEDSLRVGGLIACIDEAMEAQRAFRTERE